MFHLTITLGNEAMQTPQDVAKALQTVAQRLLEWHATVGDGDTHNIRDLNGNTVGTWRYEG